MRMILIAVQLVVLLIVGFAIAAAGSGIAAFPGLAAGTGPAAVAGGTVIFMALGAAVVGLVVVAIPASILAAVTLVAAIASGYRYFRWARIPGIFANIVAGGIILLPRFAVEGYPPWLMYLLLMFPCGNILLFLLMPKCPRVALTRRMCRVGIGLLFLLIAGLWCVVISKSSSSFATGDYFLFGTGIVLSLFPFYYAVRTVSFTKQPNRRLAIRLGIVAVTTALFLVALFPLGLTLAICLYALAGLTELSLLYPVVPPPDGSVRHWFAKTLGRLPVETASSMGNAEESVVPPL